MPWTVGKRLVGQLIPALSKFVHFPCVCRNKMRAHLALRETQRERHWAVWHRACTRETCTVYMHGWWCPLAGLFFCGPGQRRRPLLTSLHHPFS